MDDLEKKVVEALYEAHYARRIAERLFDRVIELEMKVRSSKTPDSPLPSLEATHIPPEDPFETEELAETPLLKVSPFRFNTSLSKKVNEPVQTPVAASEEIEKGLTQADELKKELWDDAIA